MKGLTMLPPMLFIALSVSVWLKAWDLHSNSPGSRLGELEDSYSPFLILLSLV